MPTEVDWRGGLPVPAVLAAKEAMRSVGDRETKNPTSCALSRVGRGSCPRRSALAVFVAYILFDRTSRAPASWLKSALGPKSSPSRFVCLSQGATSPLGVAEMRAWYPLSD